MVARPKRSGATKLPAKLLLTTIREYGLLFETGVPVAMPFYRNTESSRRHGVALQRDGMDLGLKVEPAGRYMLHRQPNYRDLPGLETGTVRFRSPLVLEHVSTKSTGWKGRLSAAFGGKKGKNLSKAIVKAGYDGIVTVDRYSRDPSQWYTSEIVDLTFLVPAGSSTRRPTRRRGSLSFRRGSLAKLVSAPELLYHGTAAVNLMGILEHGELVPGKGSSPHRTKTKGAVFLTDEPVNAVMYGSAFGADKSFVVFEVATAGLDVLPDYDDAGRVIGWDVEELASELKDRKVRWEPEVGRLIPDDSLAHDIVEILDEYDQSERATPSTLSVEWVDGKPYLYANPYLCQHIDDSATRAALDYDLYESIEDPIGGGVDVSYDDGEPCIVTLQYMVTGKIALPYVRRVFVSKRWFEEQGVRVPRGAKRLTVVNPGYIRTPMDEDGYAMTVDEAVDAGLEGQIGFSKHEVVVLNVAQLYKAVLPKGSAARRWWW